MGLKFWLCFRSAEKSEGAADIRHEDDEVSLDLEDISGFR